MLIFIRETKERRVDGQESELIRTPNVNEAQDLLKIILLASE